MAQHTKQKKAIPRWVLIAIALVLSVVLYLAGVYTGLNSSNILQTQVTQNLADLKNFMDSSTLDLKNLQLQQLFIDSFEAGNAENKCRFLDLYIDHLYGQMSSFWSVLPSRLESYEQTHAATPEYTSLKREYIRFSLRFWLIARQDYENCETRTYIPILYFYSKDCKDCIRQGEQFDAYTTQMKLQNKTVIIFPVDGEFPDDTTYLLKSYYNVTSYPAMVVFDRPVQGRVYSSDEINAMVQAPQNQFVDVLPQNVSRELLNPQSNP